MNVKGLALVPPDDSTIQVAVKASIDDQFATLAASILAGRNPSAIPSGSIEDLLDSLGDLTLNHTPTTVATRFSSRTAGGGTATSSARSGSALPVDGQEENLEIMHDTGKMTRRSRLCSQWERVPGRGSR